LALTRLQLVEIFATLHFEENVRAQELPVSQFVQLAETLQAFVPSRHTTSRSQLQEFT
jgi:16S rRNA A1518/A1519 N6-dimethyltransferase RsmA/KsgA/DIM1 with predicted DNA glycosylase/AP lyase activity